MGAISLFLRLYLNEPIWSRLKVRILLYFAHAKEVRKAIAIIIDNKEYIKRPSLLKRSIDFQVNHYPITAHIVGSPIIPHIAYSIQTILKISAQCSTVDASPLPPTKF